MVSYWEQESFLHYDYIVVGSGIVGLSAAIELRERFPDKSILILERGIFPAGASTRNAGFACMGSLTELLDDAENMPLTEVLQLYEDRKKGLEILRKRLGDDAIGYQDRESYELIREAELPHLNALETMNQLLFPVNGKPTFSLAPEKVQAFGFNSDEVKTLIRTEGEGALHTGKMMQQLLLYAHSRGIMLRTGALVRQFEEYSGGVRLDVEGGTLSEKHTLHCDHLLLCTNAFTRQLLPDADVRPGRGQVLITEPIPNLPFQGVFHADQGYYYFREIAGRVLFGGGRNLDFEGETTTEPELSTLIQNDLEHKLRHVILPHITDVKIANRWAGIMAFGPNKRPVVARFGERVTGVFRLGGMGVALGSLVARQAVALCGD